MKEYTLDAMKYGTDPDFWKWFYEEHYKKAFFTLRPKAKMENYIDTLEKTLSELKENIDWAKYNDTKDSWMITHSKKSLLVQISVLKEYIGKFYKKNKEEYNEILIHSSIILKALKNECIHIYMKDGQVAAGIGDGYFFFDDDRGINDIDVYRKMFKDKALAFDIADALVMLKEFCFDEYKYYIDYLKKTIEQEC